MKTDEQMGSDAAKLAHQKILREAGRVKLTKRKVLQRISDGLDAFENKVFYDRQAGVCVYSRKLVNWETRSRSIDQSMVVLDMKPGAKSAEDEFQAQPVKIIREVVDGRKVSGNN